MLYSDTRRHPCLSKFFVCPCKKNAHHFVVCIPTRPQGLNILCSNLHAWNDWVPVLNWDHYICSHLTATPETYSLLPRLSQLILRPWQGSGCPPIELGNCTCLRVKQLLDSKGSCIWCWLHSGTRGRLTTIYSLFHTLGPSLGPYRSSLSCWSFPLLQPSHFSPKR